MNTSCKRTYCPTTEHNVLQPINYNSIYRKSEIDMWHMYGSYLMTSLYLFIFSDSEKQYLW